MDPFLGVAKFLEANPNYQLTIPLQGCRVGPEPKPNPGFTNIEIPRYHLWRIVSENVYGTNLQPCYNIRNAWISLNAQNLNIGNPLELGDVFRGRFQPRFRGPKRGVETPFTLGILWGTLVGVGNWTLESWRLGIFTLVTELFQSKRDKIISFIVLQ